MAKQVSKLKGYDNIFAQRLRDLMKERHVTQDTLAEKAGCTRQSISQYMDGSTAPNVDKLLNIAEFFDVSVDYLLGRTSAKTTDRDIRFVCEFTGLDDVSIQKLHRNIDTSFNICNEMIDFFLSDKAELDFESLCGYFEEYKQSVQEYNGIKKIIDKLSVEKFNERLSEASNNIDLSEFKVQKISRQLLEIFSGKRDELFTEEEMTFTRNIANILIDIKNKSKKAGDDHAHNPETQ